MRYKKLHALSLPSAARCALVGTQLPLDSEAVTSYIWVQHIIFSFLERPRSPRSVRGPDMDVFEFESFNITWEPPENSAAFDLRNYQINVASAFPLQYSNDTQVTIEGLPPGEYNASVMAITECDTDGVAASDQISVGRLL